MRRVLEEGRMLRLGVLLIVTLVVGVACGDESGGPTPAQTESAASPVATTSPIAPPPRESSTPDAGGVTRNPVPARLAATAGRGDCPGGWLVYESPAFTVCYPPDQYAETWSTEVFPLRLAVYLAPGPPVAYTPYSVDVWAAQSYIPLTRCLFEAERVDPSAESSLAAYEIAGVSGVACTARTTYAIQFKGGAPTSFGALEFRVNAGTDGQLQLAKKILSTVRLVPLLLPDT